MRNHDDDKMPTTGARFEGPVLPSDSGAMAKGDEPPRCDHICLLDEGHVERGELHFYGYENPSPRRHAADCVPDRLRLAILDMCERFVPFGEDEDGWITRYVITSGTVHRLIGAAQAAGIPAVFRALGKERTDDDNPGMEGPWDRPVAINATDPYKRRLVPCRSCGKPADTHALALLDRCSAEDLGDSGVGKSGGVSDGPQ